MMRFAIALAPLLAATVATMPAHAATTVDWTFSGTYDGGGVLTYDDTGFVTALSGTYNNQVLSLITPDGDPNNPNANIGPIGNGIYNYHGVPNTGGADYQFDNKIPLTEYGILVSTGIGSDERVYDPSLTNGTPDFFSIDPNGAYVHDFGTFATTPTDTGAVPEPAAWAMMILGMGAIGYMMRRSRQAVRPTVSFA